MIVPQLQPQEWLEGYRGRVARIHAIDSRSQVEDDLQAFAEGAASTKKLGMVEAVSAALGRPVIDVVMANTLWPALVSVNRPSRAEIAALASKRSSRHVFSKALRPMFWFCPMCAADERARWGYSVWHRAHQVPGETECQIHGNPLHGVPRMNLLQAMPHESSLNGTSVPHPLAKDGETLVVRRALSVIRQSASGQLSLSLEKCESALRTRADELGLNSATSDSASAVAQKVCELYSPGWLKDAMPGGRAGLTTFAFVNSILGTRTQARSCAAIAIVAAALFDDVASTLQQCSV